MKYKQNDKNRTRNLSAGVKLTQEEQERFKTICKVLNITKLEFLLKAIREEEEKLRNEKDM